MSVPLRAELTEDGPLLVNGPITITRPDGTTMHSTRPVTALCTCRRSRLFPLCDTSHRDRVRRRRPTDQE